MNVHLVDGPIAGYQELNLNIKTVEINGNGGWITLASPNRTLNLLNLVGGVDETLAAGATLPAGHYQQMRLVLGSGNTIRLADGTLQPLTVPSGLQSGVKLVVNFDVAAGTTKDVWIDFDAAHSIQVVQAGASGQYLLRPTVQAFDKVATGSIHGVLTDAATSVALPGVAVHAETFDASGSAVLSRSTVTDATGAYTLDLLPVGSTYYVVSQPVTGAGAALKVYDAKASNGLALTTAAPVFTYSAAFTADAAVGGVSGGITPLATSSQSDQVNLLQTLVTPASGTHDFIVQSTMATTATTETYGFPAAPVAIYGVQAWRTTLNADGSTTLAASTIQPAPVVASTTLTVNLGF
jgi:hypothetical protein